MNSIIYIVGLVVVVGAILSFVGLRHDRARSGRHCITGQPDRPRFI